MDVIFAMAGLMMYWSLTSFLNREANLKRKLTDTVAPNLISIEVPFAIPTVQAELKHFVKRNHLQGTYVSSAKIHTLIVKTDDFPNLRFPIYLKQTGENKSVVEVGAVDLNGAPYFLFRKRHMQATAALGDYFYHCWKRKNYVLFVAKKELAVNQ